MAGTSVSGNSGPGVALNKGSKNTSLGIHNLIGPHIVAAGVVTLTGTTATVELPAQPLSFQVSEQIPDNVSNYMILLTSNSVGAVYVSTALAAISSTNTWQFTLTSGTSAATVNWVCVRIGLG